MNGKRAFSNPRNRSAQGVGFTSSHTKQRKRSIDVERFCLTFPPTLSDISQEFPKISLTTEQRNKMAKRDM